MIEPRSLVGQAEKKKHYVCLLIFKVTPEMSGDCTDF